MPKTGSLGNRMECPARNVGGIPETATGYEPFAWPAMTNHDIARPPHEKT